MQVEVDLAALDRPFERGDSAFFHHQLDLDPLTGFQREDDFVFPHRRFSRGFLRVGRADNGNKDHIQQAWLQRRLWLDLAFHHQTVGFCLFGKFRLDLAHLGQAKNAADAGRVDPVFRGPDHRDKDQGRRPCRDGSGAPELARGWQVIKVRSLCVVHDLSFHESARPVS